MISKHHGVSLCSIQPLHLVTRCHSPLSRDLGIFNAVSSSINMLEHKMEESALNEEELPIGFPVHFWMSFDTLWLKWSVCDYLLILHVVKSVTHFNEDFEVLL